MSDPKLPDAKFSDATLAPGLNPEPPRAASRQAAPDRVPLNDDAQPDPMLRMSSGHMAAGSITLAALGVALILGVVFYGLNSGGNEQTAAAPPAASPHPAAGGQGGPPTPTAPRANESGVKG